MHGRTSNGLGYKGIVHLSLYSKATNKTIPIATVHNEGKAKLFEFLSDCLVGNFAEAAAKTPTKILLLNQTNGNGNTYNYQAMSDFIVKLTNPIKVENPDGVTVRFSFVVQNAFNVNFTHIGLYLANTEIYEVDDFAAICSYEAGSNDLSGQDAALVVDWDLSLSNQTS